MKFIYLNSRGTSAPLRWLLAMLLLVPALAWAKTGNTRQTLELSSQFETSVYQTLEAASAQGKVEPVKSLAQLVQMVNGLKAEQPAQTLIALHRYKNFLIQSGNKPDAQALIHTALQLQDAQFVRDLLVEFEAEADDYAAARAKFELARYYADSLQWPRVLEEFKEKEVFDRLPLEQGTEAQLLVGTALQKLKKHRQAISVYEKIKPGSQVYRLVLLNLATAYLRQDWWTDAQLAIEKSLQLNEQQPTELDYRMHTVLGFAQLQFGFYRDARTSFRQVALSSSYTERALFGLGLAALNQKDFAGALNAFSRLRALKSNDISVAESYLLYAFTLRQMQQFDASLSAYQEAIDFYQMQLARFNDTGQMDYLRSEHRRDPLLANLQKKQTLVAALLKLQPGSANLLALDNTLVAALSARRTQFLNAEAQDLESYLSQSKFGLASLYDPK